MTIKEIISQVWDKSKTSFLSLGGGTLTNELAYTDGSNTFKFIHTGSDKSWVGNELALFTLGYGEEIPENANLNDYFLAGNYYCQSDVCGATIANNPIGGAMIMKEWGSYGNSIGSPYENTWQYHTQLIISTNQWYIRHQSNGNNKEPNWSDWNRFVMANANNVIDGYTVKGAVYN